MSEQEDLPDFLQSISKFCRIYKKLDTNEYVVGHSCLRHIRHLISVYPDDIVMISNNSHDFKIRMSKDQYVNYTHVELKKAIQKNIGTLINDLERYHLNYTDIKLQPLDITKTKVQQLASIYGDIENGMCSVKLSVTVYDNWLLFKKVRYSHNVVVGFAKDVIYATICDEKSETCGTCESISNVDDLISELITIQHNKGVDL